MSYDDQKKNLSPEITPALWQAALIKRLYDLYAILPQNLRQTMALVIEDTWTYIDMSHELSITKQPKEKEKIIIYIYDKGRILLGGDKQLGEKILSFINSNQPSKTWLNIRAGEK